MSQEISDSDRLRRIEVAVCGDENAGIPGLAQRVKTLETWKGNLNLRFAAVGGGASVLFFLAEKLFSVVFGK